MKRLKNYELYKHSPVYTTKELLSYCNEKYGTRPAFLYEKKKGDETVLYSEFKEQVEALGTYIYKNGLKNCHIAVYGENSYNWILTHFAVTTGNNVIVPIDKELEADDIEYLLRDSDCKAIFYSNTYYDIIDELKERNIEGLKFINLRKLSKHIEEGREAISEGYREFLDAEVNKDDLASIVYTSGTTGRSKGVMLTHGNFCASMYGACCNADLTGSTLLVLPLHHTFGLTASIYAVMFYGNPICINKSLRNLASDFKKYSPTSLFGVPLMIEALHRNIWTNAKKQGKDKALRALMKVSDALLSIGIDLRKKVFKSVIDGLGGELVLLVTGGAPVDEKHLKDFTSFGITVLNGYGITECGPIVAVNRNKFNVHGSVGVPLCCNEVKISDDGEILVKGDNVMVGYYHNEEANKEVFTEDGWFRTGDIGAFDEYGALHITGRIKNLIILANGENIPAEPIEQEVNAIPYVKEVIVYGEENVIVAEVFLDEEVENAKDMIDADIKKVNEKLPQIRNIGKIVVRDTEFPKTTTKKIKRNYGGKK